MRDAERAMAEPADLGWALEVVLRTYRDRAAVELESLPRQFRGYQVLATALVSDGPSQRDLADRLGIDRTVMTYIVDDLARDGLVDRVVAAEDRRQRRIVVTERGRTEVAAACERMRVVEKDVLVGLSAGQREVFRELVLTAAVALASAAITDRAG